MTAKEDANRATTTSEPHVDEHANKTNTTSDSHAEDHGNKTETTSEAHVKEDVHKTETTPEGHYDYVLMLDDTVVMSETNFVPVIKDFIQNYSDIDWDIVQFDALGPGGQRHPVVVESAQLKPFREKMVFSPKSSSGYFSGFQAVLMKAKSLPHIMEKMASMKVMPIEFLLKEINEKHFKNLTALTYQAGITRSVRTSLRTGDLPGEPIPQP